MQSLYLKEAQGSGGVFPCLPAWVLACFWWLPAQPGACGINAVGRPDAQEGFSPTHSHAHTEVGHTKVSWTVKFDEPLT